MSELVETSLRELKLSEGIPELRVSQVTAELLSAATRQVGAAVVGRRLYDITNGWNGHPGGEIPMVVLTHNPPADWPRDGVPIQFAARAVLDAGLLDEITVSLAPVILGEGIPWFAES